MTFRLFNRHRQRLTLELEFAVALEQASHQSLTEVIRLGGLCPSQQSPRYPLRPFSGSRLSPSSLSPGSHYEPKFNGWRALVEVVLDTGEALWLDCEALERRHGLGQRSLIVFDLPTLGMHSYRVRRAALETLGLLPAPLDPLAYAQDQLYLCPSFPADQALTLWETLRQQNARSAEERGLQSASPCAGGSGVNAARQVLFYEGLVAKRADSLYPSNFTQPSTGFPGWIKHRYD